MLIELAQLFAPIGVLCERTECYSLPAALPDTLKAVTDKVGHCEKTTDSLWVCVTQRDGVRADAPLGLIKLMPILKKEVDLNPANLFDEEGPLSTDEGQWWALYTRSRREKELMRRLTSKHVAFYSPIIEHQHRSPNGRLRTSYLPLFSNYVFLWGNENDRHASLTTGCVSRDLEVTEPEGLVRDLIQIRELIELGTDLTPESRIEPGSKVRVKSGMLTGRVGIVIERRGQRRLLVSVDFLQQGASVELTPCDLELLDG